MLNLQLDLATPLSTGVPLAATLRLAKAARRIILTGAFRIWDALLRIFLLNCSSVAIAISSSLCGSDKLHPVPLYSSAYPLFVQERDLFPYSITVLLSRVSSFHHRSQFVYRTLAQEKQANTFQDQEELQVFQVAILVIVFFLFRTGLKLSAHGARGLTYRADIQLVF